MDNDAQMLAPVHDAVQNAALVPPIFLEGGLSPLHLQPSIVTIQTLHQHVTK